MKMLRFPQTALVIAMMAAGPAAAHDLLVVAEVDGDEVVTEARYGDGAVPGGVIIRVLDPAGELVHRLNADVDGTARFAIDGATEGFTIEAHDDDGHDAYWIVTPQDLAGGD